MGPALCLAPGGWLTWRYVSQPQKKVSGVKIVAPDGTDIDVGVDVDEKNVFRGRSGGEIGEFMHGTYSVTRSAI